MSGIPNIKQRHRTHKEQSWIRWIMANRFVLIIAMIAFLVLVGPWLFCDVLGFSSICSIVSGIFSLVSGIFSLISKIFNLVGL